METKSPSFGMGARFSRTMTQFRIMNAKKYEAAEKDVKELSKDVKTFVESRQRLALAGNSVTVTVSELPKKGLERIKQIVSSFLGKPVKKPKPVKKSMFVYWDTYDKQIVNLTKKAKSEFIKNKS